MMRGAVLAALASVTPAWSEPIRVLEDRIRIEVPENFVALSEEAMARFYPLQTPQLAYSDPAGRLHIALSAEPLGPDPLSITPDGLAEAKAGVEAGITIIEWRIGEIRRIGGLESIFLAFVAAPHEGDAPPSLNHMIVTVREGEVIGINIACELILEVICTDVADQFIASVRLR